tara:strand:+ start:6513 stop:7457 length:945 start_codon:yes stop_codon:yes gene_type:complete
MGSELWRGQSAAYRKGYAMKYIPEAFHFEFEGIPVRCWRYCFDGDGGDGGGTGGEEPGVAAVAAAEATAAAEDANATAAAMADAATQGVSSQEDANVAASAVAPAEAAAVAAEANSDTSPESGTPQGIFGGPASMINPTKVGAGILALGMVFPGFGPVSTVIGGLAMALEAMGAVPAPGTSSDPSASPGEGFDAPGAPEGADGGDFGVDVLPPSPPSPIETGVPLADRRAVASILLSIDPPNLPTIQSAGSAGATSSVIRKLEATQDGAATVESIINGSKPSKGLETTVHAGRGMVDPASLFSPKLFPVANRIG